MNSPTDPVVRAASVAGHAVRSVVARDEPERHRARALSDLSSALPSMEAMSEMGAVILRVATTPDFHPGRPVPVGVVADVRGAVLPHLIGNDVGCGMRMIALEGVTENDLVPGLDARLRHSFFQGGRDVALTGRDRHAILREGLPGLLESLSGPREGLLARLDLATAWRDLDRTSDDGMFSSSSVDAGFEDYARIDDVHRRDAIMGTVGGGNHFVEFGVVEKVVDGPYANVAGLSRSRVVIVVHSGSLDFGQRIGTTVKEALHACRHSVPDHRVLSPEVDEALYYRYLNGHANAANAAFANRFLIGLAALEALRSAIGREVGHRLVYDAPHNTVWRDGDVVRHRKGACPARGPGALRGGPYEFLGEPVVLPGSMGDGTWLLRGLGSEDGLHSSAHGAGRRLSRQEARSSARLDGALRVVGPVDPHDPRVRGRADVVAELEGRLREEAPGAYRPIETVVDPMVGAGLVGKVAKIRPVLTVKG
ncbi:RtcB family protein [Rhizobium leguminosarum]|uniref:RtcB family protein n=1 Tax=Rhizobium leguminosarum TaxID=384 RepID=UPI002E115672|nr:RtcB family protein [Rhizobium leguminosarum]WSH77916.1 RtcB family protein [Rhizobium leguminosarum]